MLLGARAVFAAAESGSGDTDLRRPRLGRGTALHRSDQSDRRRLAHHARGHAASSSARGVFARTAESGTRDYSAINEMTVAPIILQGVPNRGNVTLDRWLPYILCIERSRHVFVPTRRRARSHAKVKVAGTSWASYLAFRVTPGICSPNFGDNLTAPSSCRLPSVTSSSPAGCPKFPYLIVVKTCRSTSVGRFQCLSGTAAIQQSSEGTVNGLAPVGSQQID